MGTSSPLSADSGEDLLKDPLNYVHTHGIPKLLADLSGGAGETHSGLDSLESFNFGERHSASFMGNPMAFIPTPSKTRGEVIGITAPGPRRIAVDNVGFRVGIMVLPPDAFGSFVDVS